MSSTLYPIYKVNYLVNGLIDTIYVFSGNESLDGDKSLDGNESLDKDTLFKKSFLEEELNAIQANNTNVVFSTQQIHMDDSIGVIKIKILNEIKKNVSIEELYLFCQQLETLNSVSLYQSLTQNKRIELTDIRLSQFISNIVSDSNGDKFATPERKDVYDYDDILQMKLDGKSYITNKVLGQKFFIIENEYPFICNPYLVNSYDTFFERTARKSLSTLNSHLLLSSGHIINNNIYICLAKDVLQFVSDKNVSEETTMKVYYPFLYDKNITSLEELAENQQTLVDANKKIINEKTNETFKTVSMFYDIYKQKKTDLKYVSKGIKYIKALMIPDFEIKFPLEIIFKIIHANKTNPLIKYNPSPKQENIYRLFTDKIANDGRRIPYLKKSTIIQLMRDIGKSKSVAVYIEQESQIIVCEFDENGYITISCDFVNVMNEDEINKLFVELINPIIEEVKNLLEQSGYKLTLFKSLQETNIQIKQMSYETQIEITKPVDLKLYNGCISSVFASESSNSILRLKRVSNFNKVTSQEAFILEKIEDGFKGDKLVELLLENYPNEITREEAIQMIRDIANEVQLEHGARKSNIKIKNNPGFKTTFTTNKQTGIITIVVENINDVNYLSTIPIYLDSMVRLTQDMNSTGFPSKEIMRLCSTREKEEVKVEDILSPTESSMNDEGSMNEGSTLAEDKDETYYNTGDAKTKDAFDLIFGDEDYEDEEEENAEGGANSNSSESTISSIMSNEELQDELEEDGEKEKEKEKEKEQDELEEEGEKEEQDDELEEEQEDGEKEKEEDQDELEEQEEQEGDELEDGEKDVLEEKDELEEEQVVNEVKKLDGISLKKPAYFQELIEKRDPVLILKRPTKHFSNYSRICRSDIKRQPVILTDEELANIKSTHKDFLRDEDVITYGSNPKKKYNYICPRYWCLKTNSIVNAKDLKEVFDKDGKNMLDENGDKILEHPTCGRVLPSNASSVKPGYYVYEFYKSKPNKNDYKRYPGLIPDLHPDGLCLPCCFDKYNTVGRKNENKKCLAKNTDETNPADKKEKPIQKVVEKEKEQDEYIIKPDKYPLQPGRWGYLPLNIQQMLRVVNADCQISKTNTNIKQDHPCLVRHGVEINDKQSFIACISDAVFFSQLTADKKVKRILSIEEMKQRILKSLSIDKFIKYQNGNLVVDFHNMNIDVDYEKYKDTKLYSKIDFDKEEEVFYFKKVITAFENFSDYLNDADSIIDHTYLWDIVCTPNKYIFPSGVNLIIFKLPNDDITNNVELVCPSNHYSSEFYDARKPTIFLVQQSTYYEPIYSYTNKGNKISVAKDFKEYDPNLPINIKIVIKEIIKPFFNTVCRPLSSMPEGGLPSPSVYEAQRPLLLYNLVNKLDKYKYEVNKLVINFNNKVIGVLATSPTNNSGFIPCYPSALNEELKENLDFVFMTDVSLWRTYDETYTFLEQLSKRSKKKRDTPDIPCKPQFKVVEDGLVVGILTETNQFIQLSQPIPETEIKTYQNIQSIDNDNFIVNAHSKTLVNADVPITTTNTVDTERVDYIKKIKMETNFYNVFRNTIRILLNDYNNVDVRERIENEISKDYIIYTTKLKNVNELLQKLVGNKIQFTGSDNYYKLIDEVSTCIVKNADSCKKSSNICAVTNGSCDLILPEKNLMTNKINKPIYFGRIADELIRYNRINSFMFQPQKYLSFGKLGYNLRDDEMIMIQSLLKEYFELDLVPSIINKYVRFNSHDETKPIITQSYENTVVSGDLTKPATDSGCDVEKRDKITSKLWKGVFPNNYIEIGYRKTTVCTFNLIIDLVSKKTNTTLTVNKIKQILYEEYQKYLEDYQSQIIDILITEGKKTLGDQLKAEFISFASFISAENYYITPLDLWILVQHFKIPTIFISQREILQTTYKKNVFVGYGERDEAFTFIVIPGLKPENIPGFDIIENDNGEVFISLDKVVDNTLILEAFENRISIEDYISSFSKKALTQSVKKRKIKIVQEQTKEKTATSSPLTDDDVLNKSRKNKVVLKGRKKGTQKKKLKIVTELLR